MMFTQIDEDHGIEIMVGKGHNSPAHHNATGDAIMKLQIDRYDFERILMLLDAADDALTAAANLEKRQEARKSLRQITAQERAKGTRETVAEMTAKYL